MKLRDRLLGLVVMVAAGFAGCAVCDTCDDFPAPCTGPNCGQNGMPAYMNGPTGPGPAVMGSSTPAMDDSAGPGPMMPPAAPSMAAPATPVVNPTTTEPAAR